MKNMMTLLRRELWESPVAFKWTPVGIGVLLLLVLTLSLLFVREVDTNGAFTMDLVRLTAESDLAERRSYLSIGFLGLAGIFNMIMFVVVLFYLTHSLYDDRKDRSILFWKSMPVSDTQTVLSKLATACLVVPLSYFIFTAATWLGVLLIATVYGFVAGVNPFSAFWLPAIDPGTWVLQLSSLLVMALWLLPIYGWLMFCSAWAPRLPILMGMGIPLLLGLFQNFYSWITRFGFPDLNIWTLFFERILDGLSGMATSGLNFSEPSSYAADAFVSFGGLGRKMASLEMWIGVAIGMLFIAAAIYFRKRATDS